MIQPIETHYRGYRFRSRLEARWAVFFQALGLRWDYEPEGYTLSTGLRYLPDFLVQTHSGGMWVEVKPGNVSAEPFEQFMKDQADNTRGTILREIPDPRALDTSGAHEHDEQHEMLWGGGGWDNLYQFCICEDCGAVDFIFEGRSERIRCTCNKGRDKLRTANHIRLRKAYTAARSARFEYGEVPA